MRSLFDRPPRRRPPSPPETPAERARKLLCQHLSPEQKVQFFRYGYFDVVARRNFFKRRWRIYPMHSNSVRLILFGAPLPGDYCVTMQPFWDIPPYDLMLAIKLMLETKPRMFFSRSIDIGLAQGLGISALIWGPLIGGLGGVPLLGASAFFAGGFLLVRSVPYGRVFRRAG